MALNGSRLLSGGFGFLLVLALLTSPAQARKRSPGIVESVAQDLKAAMVKAPVDQEVCFSPDEPCDVKLAKFIESAQKSIDVAIYDINLDQVVHQLLVQARKIPVRIVVDKRQSKGTHSLVPLLIKAGADLRYGRQRGIMHNKFVIVDGKMLETGSFNFTNHAATSNNENQVYLASPGIVERFRKRFEEIWGRAKSPRQAGADRRPRLYKDGSREASLSSPASEVAGGDFADEG